MKTASHTPGRLKQLSRTASAGKDRGRLRIILGLLLAICLTPACGGYAVLTHEAIIDAAWKDNIAPQLLKRFPHATPKELLRAHAYVYGGAIIQDLGYYPSGSKFFSDLTHYVRSGDFVLALLSESKDLNEYAFALGALAHYAADRLVTRSRPIPRLRSCIPTGPEIWPRNNL